MKNRYLFITIVMLMPLAITAAGYFAAQDVMAPDITMFLALDGAALLLGGVFMLQARLALRKKGTHVGPPHNKVKVSGKKGEAMLLNLGAWLTGLLAALITALIMIKIY